MGCGHANQRVEEPKQVNDNKLTHPNVGTIKIRIQQLNFIGKNQQFLSVSSKYLKFTLSNQDYTSMLHHNFGHTKKVIPQPSQLTFTINTIEKQRHLSVLLFTKQELRGQTKLAVSEQNVTGLILLNTVEQSTKQVAGSSTEKTIHMKLDSEDGTKIGWLVVIFQFIPQKYEVLSIKINSITLRNNSLVKRKVYVRIQIGQEIYESVSAQEDRKSIPSWSDALHNFIVPASLSEGIVQVYEKKKQQLGDQLLGQLRLNLKSILADEGLQSYSQQITLNDETTGTIKLQTFKNKEQNLQQVQLDSPKKIKLQQPRALKQDDTFRHISSIDSFKKVIDSQSTTNVTSNKTRNSFSARLSSQHKSKSKLPISITKLPISKSKIILPPIQTYPKTSRQGDCRFSLVQNQQNTKSIDQNPENVQKQQKKIATQKDKMESSFEKIQFFDCQRLNMIKTSSVLINKPQQPKQNTQDQFIQLDFQKDKDDFLVEEYSKIQKRHSKQKVKESQIDHFRRNSKVYSSFDRIDVDNLVERKEEVGQKFIHIQKDLESRYPSTFTNSKVCIIVEAGYTQFELSLKEQSNESQLQSQSQSQKVQSGNFKKQSQKFHQAQSIDQQGLQKINIIKGISKFSKQEFENSYSSFLNGFDTSRQKNNQQVRIIS